MPINIFVMKTRLTISLIILFFCCGIFQLQAQSNTIVTVRAQAKDAKFIGDGMGGALITIVDSATHDTLASGLTKGGTGNTETLVSDPIERYEKLSSAGDAKFQTTLSLQKPRLVTITATAPQGHPQAAVSSSTQTWLFPGKDITGDGIILEIPGFVINNRLPQGGQEFASGAMIPIRAHIEMMCGCPTSDGGMWDSSEYEIMAQLWNDNEMIREVPLSFTGDTSLFESKLKAPSESGNYTVLLYAFHPSTENSGVAKTSISVK